VATRSSLARDAALLDAILFLTRFSNPPRERLAGDGPSAAMLAAAGRPYGSVYRHAGRSRRGFGRRGYGLWDAVSVGYRCDAELDEAGGSTELA